MKKKKTIKEYITYYSLFWLVRKKFPLILFAGYSVEKPNTQGKGVRKEKMKEYEILLTKLYRQFLKFI